MATKLWAIGLVLLTTLLTSTAQIFYKFGSETLEFNLIKIITNYNLIMGLSLYVVGAILLILAFRGGDVSVLYPIFATSYIWVSFLSIWFFGENMNLFRWLGVITIIIGISLISYGSKSTKTEAVT